MSPGALLAKRRGFVNGLDVGDDLEVRAAFIFPYW